jgi:hypothetical protein
MEAVLAAYGLVAGARGPKDSPILVSPDGDEPFPVRLSPSSTSSFKELVDATEKQLREAEPHRRYALFILTNKLRLKEYGSSCPVFHAAYCVSDSGSGDDTMKSRLENYPKVYSDIDLLLTLAKHDDRTATTIELSSPTGHCTDVVLERLHGRLMDILRVVAQDERVSLGELHGILGLVEQDTALDTTPPARRGDEQLRAGSAA